MSYPFGNPWKPVEIKGEIFTKPSLTVPDQAMSIAEILTRFTHGLPVGGSRIPFYEEEDGDDIDDTMPMHMDKIERIEYIRSNARRIEELQNRASAEVKAAEIKSKSVKTPPEEKI